jgi:hypothetical protein
MATAPRGRGWVMMPTMVARKMASRCHACIVTPDGGGRNHTSTPDATEMPRFFMLAPHLKGGSEGAAVSEPVALAHTLSDGSRSWRCRRAVSGAVGLGLAMVAAALRLRAADVCLRVLWVHLQAWDAATSGATALGVA